ncbi:hypothetical protein ACE1CI_19605 [Aerosakkonemataceae cyanobacterium BLCC-F50]|uniref:LAGLIDADG homing endonuclease n=1 Tax=Floridaenema flaviceps BLCC-F50 TaxID=3153642 RepID=A0ABV4XTR5_9CYAN
MESDIAAEIIREVLEVAPRKLSVIQAELLFIEGGTYIFHYQSGDSSKYKCLSPTTLRAAFANTPIDTGWINPDSGIVRWGTGSVGEWTIKFVPPQKHEIDLLESKHLIPLPGMVFLGIKSDYWIWAIKGTKFDSEAEAFHVPLSNVYLHSYPSCGRICWGDHKPPIASPNTITNAWELFISSPFNGHLSDSKSRTQPNDVRMQIKKVVKRSSYPVKDLISTNQTIAKLVAAITDDLPPRIGRL